ncbi:hypothetical protein Mgra_00008728 [Meloidogyne graminicola]|uniref:Uncharacterized protein n=1 Tax=Meloidogyne graminicola TaxID=189291 RepID=A0A8S9ZEZ3_9BILA|nr:hypothetical protein Mgra_00008728 [Meloidogyne graminicola]
MLSLPILIIQGLLLLKIADGAKKCYFGDFVDGKIKECKESNWKCATLTCPGTVFRGCLSPNGVCDDLVNLFTSCRDANHQCFLCDGDNCNDNSTDTTNKKFEATSENDGADINTNITKDGLSNEDNRTNKNPTLETSDEILQSNQGDSGNAEENKTNQNATAEMLQSNSGNHTAENGSRGSKNKYLFVWFLISLFVIVIL